MEMKETECWCLHIARSCTWPCSELPTCDCRLMHLARLMVDPLHGQHPDEMVN